jgi:hypothetical protein
VALTSGGSWRMQDAVVRVKGSADDGETWGKRSARTRRLARRKEMMIGGVTRWLASGEWAVVAYLGLGQRMAKGRKLQSGGGIYSQRREKGERRARKSTKGRRCQAGLAAPLVRLVSPVLGC